VDTSILSILPQGTTTLTYLLDVTGGMVIFALAWWVLCFITRNGIDGSKFIVRAIKEKKPFHAINILTGYWKPLHDEDPQVPTNPGIEERWIDL
jgi:hypothetical protein